MQESYTLEKFNSGRTVVGDAITELAKTDDRIWLLTPDIGWGCADFKAAYSGRFIDTGIAEQCVVGVSAGLALEGSIPFIIGMMPFMSMRDLEQVRTDLCYQNLPVRIIANYSGLTGNGGSTHYAMEDMALFSSLVNMTVCAPADPEQLRQIILKSVDWAGPMAIRMDPGKNNAVLYPEDAQFEIGKAYTACEGSDITIIACGSDQDFKGIKKRGNQCPCAGYVYSETAGSGSGYQGSRGNRKNYHLGGSFDEQWSEQCSQRCAYG